MKFNRKHIARVLGCSAITLLSSSVYAAPTQIDVVVAYTKAAQTWAENISCSNIPDNAEWEVVCSGDNPPPQIDPNSCLENDQLCRDSAGINNLINIAIAETNAIYVNSGIDGDNKITFNLAHSYLLSDTDEQGNTQYYVEKEHGSDPEFNDLPVKALAELIPAAGETAHFRNRKDADPILNSIHDKRNQYAGDISVLIFSDEIVGGVAAGVGVQDPKNAFASVAVDIATWPEFSFAHEVSHLLGAHHEAQEVIEPLGIEVDPMSEIAYPDNKGYIDPDGAYMTIMSKACKTCDRVPYLSNNTTTLDGKPLGVESVRDNARVVQLNASTVSGFSDALPLSAEASNSAKIGIDFGYVDYYNVDYTSSHVNWNDITNHKSSGPEVALVDQGGNSTGVTLKVTKSFSGRSRAHSLSAVMMSHGVDEMPTTAMADSFTAIRWINTNPKFEIRGLIPGQAYNFRVFGSGTVVDETRISRYIVEGTEAIPGELNSAGNYYRFVDINNVVATEQNGVGLVEFTLSANKVGIFSSAWLNAIEFYAVP